jgi:hypothetical protein
MKELIRPRGSSVPVDEHPSANSSASKSDNGGTPQQSAHQTANLRRRFTRRGLLGAGAATALAAVVADPQFAEAQKTKCVRNARSHVRYCSVLPYANAASTAGQQLCL